MRDGDIGDLMSLNEATVPTALLRRRALVTPGCLSCFVLEAFSLISPSGRAEERVWLWSSSRTLSCWPRRLGQGVPQSRMSPVASGGQSGRGDESLAVAQLLPRAGGLALGRCPRDLPAVC